MTDHFSVKVYKQYLNFSASHFLLFKDGSREPLHGHNYRVKLEGGNKDLDNDLVFDFLHIKPLLRSLCDSLDHVLLLPEFNPHLKITTDKNYPANYLIETKDKSFFSVPKTDVRILPISNISVERLAEYLTQEIKKKVKEEYDFEFTTLQIEIEETPGQSAVYQTQ